MADDRDACRGGGLAALVEIVAMPPADPQTNWSSVDIRGHPEHLADMNQPVIGVESRSEPLPDGLRMRIGRSGFPGKAASRLVPALTPILGTESGWQSEVALEADDIVRTFTAADTRDVPHIRALGVFGIMATGDRHRMHRLATCPRSALSPRIDCIESRPD